MSIYPSREHDPWIFRIAAYVFVTWQFPRLREMAVPDFCHSSVSFETIPCHLQGVAHAFLVWVFLGFFFGGVIEHEVRYKCSSLKHI